MSENDFWQGVLYLHLLAMAFFVGGQLVFGIAVVPILRGDPDPERTQMRAVARRFGYGSLVGLTIVHLRRPKLHILQGAILALSLLIVWLGLEVATGG